MNIHLGIYPYYCMPKVVHEPSLTADIISFLREKKKKRKKGKGHLHQYYLGNYYY